jgi:hypothetical protein
MTNPDVEELLRYNRDGIRAECSRKGHPNRTVDRRYKSGFCEDCRTRLGYIDLIWLGEFDGTLGKLDWGDSSFEGTE